MPQIQDLFQRAGPAYLAKYGHAMLASHRRVIHDIMQCRTKAMGGEIYLCTSCDEEHHVFYSCQNRSCPTCQAQGAFAWIEARRAELLPVPYFHVIFTLPQQLRAIVRTNQTDLYTILMQAAARSLIDLASDKVGGLLAVLAMLHTAATTLAFHPHAHCLVPAGALSPDGREWLPIHDPFLVDVLDLSTLFRDAFLDLLQKRRPDLDVPPSVEDIPWNVYSKPPVDKPDNVLAYLARYVHRVAITDHRIEAIDDTLVTFRYRIPDTDLWAPISLTHEEFIRRFLQHVLPPGFHKIRYFVLGLGIRVLTGGGHSQSKVPRIPRLSWFQYTPRYPAGQGVEVGDLRWGEGMR